jgi:hypothetical protein
MMTRRSYAIPNTVEVGSAVTSPKATPKPQKKKSGRPRKYLKQEAKVNAAVTPPKAIPQPVTPKRKVGRPRKHPVQKDIAEPTPTNDTPQSQPSKRDTGMPKKDDSLVKEGDPDTSKPANQDEKIGDASSNGVASVNSQPESAANKANSENIETKEKNQKEKEKEIDNKAAQNDDLIKWEKSPDPEEEIVEGDKDGDEGARNDGEYEEKEDEEDGKKKTKKRRQESKGR